MSYNKNSYNTRNSGRFNTPGQFVPAAAEKAPAQPPLPSYTPTQQTYSPSALPQRKPQQQQQQTPKQQPQQQQQQPKQQLQQQKPQQPPLPAQPPKPAQAPSPQQNQNVQSLQSTDVEMKPVAESLNNSGANLGQATPRPYWMKTRLQGVKKISNKERRRRQNQNLRRLLTPKNALMVLNEMMPNEQLTNQFKVEPSGQGQFNNQFYNQKQNHSFCAEITVNGTTYKGYGDNKMVARNVAAEQAIRDLIIQKMNKVLGPEGNEDSVSMSEGGEEGEDETLPMIQLASFALHKLFSEWEYEGHKVPQLKPTSGSVSEGGSEASVASSVKPRVPQLAPAPKKKELPENAATMHPCMLLTYMRPHLEYRELAVDGDRPQNMVFTLGVDVDGSTYIGKAANKKEARKQAAKTACTTMWGVRFVDNSNENAPKAAA